MCIVAPTQHFVVAADGTSVRVARTDAFERPEWRRALVLTVVAPASDGVVAAQPAGVPLANSDALERSGGGFVLEHPTTDRTAMRQLVRAAADDEKANKRGVNFKRLFKRIKFTIGGVSAADEAAAGVEDSES